MTDFPDDEEFPHEPVGRRNAYCQRRSLKITAHPPGIGLEAIVWPTTLESMLKVHRNVITFDRELAVYQRLAERSVSRLQGFDIPQLLHYARNCWLWNSRLCFHRTFWTSARLA